MPHDKIRSAIRSRMAETGEPYSVARRAVIAAHRAAEYRVRAEISLDNAIGVPFRQLDLAAPYRAQIAEMSKVLAQHLAATVAEPLRQLDLAASYRAQIAEMSRVLRNMASGRFD
jgi:hypothetical protein